MPTPSLTAFLNTAERAARSAARVITHYSKNRERLEVEAKSVNDFVTSADKAAEAAILDELTQSYPKHCFLTEEAGISGNRKSNYCWVIDPIDGTTNFMHDLPQYAVSIGLTYKGQPIVGVIYDVAKDEMFTAIKGKGAFLDKRRIRVSDTTEMERALIGTGFPFRRDDDLESYLVGFKKVASRVAGLRRPGSAALDLAWVACGRYDAFWEMNLSPWDICAGTLMVLEAGGLVTDLEAGQNYLTTGAVIAGTPKIFAQLFPLVGQVDEALQAANADSEPTKTLSVKAPVEAATFDDAQDEVWDDDRAPKRRVASRSTSDRSGPRRSDRISDRSSDRKPAASAKRASAKKSTRVSANKDKGKPKGKKKASAS